MLSCQDDQSYCLHNLNIKIRALIQFYRQSQDGATIPVWRSQIKRGVRSEEASDWSTLVLDDVIIVINLDSLLDYVQCL